MREASRNNKNAVKTGLYLNLEKLDGRTAPARAKKEILNALRDYVGNVSILHEILIHEICYKTIRLGEYEITKLTDGKGMDEADHYIPLSNSLRLDIQQLERMVDKNQRAPDLTEYVKKAYGKKK